jgi:hypothetical protein
MADPLVSVSQNQVSAVLDGETILLSAATNLYYGLDPVGSRIWQLIQEPRRISYICSQLALDFEVDPALCEHDTRELLQRLADADLVKLED